MSYLIETLEVHNIPYVIYKKRYKRVSIKYNTNCVLEIRQPLGFPDVEMIRFVENHLDWIIIHKPIRPLPHETYKDNDSYYLLGKEYILNIIYSNYQDVLICGNKIIIHTANNQNITVLLEKFRYEQAEIVFNEILYRSFISIQDKMLRYPNLIIKSSKSRWGCCYINENKIMLNISLIHVPLDLIEYVVFHELVHFVIPNHSKEFHDLLNRYVHNEKEKRNRLKNYCIVYK